MHTRHEVPERFGQTKSQELGLMTIREGSICQEAAQSQEQEARLAEARTPEKLAHRIPSVGTERPPR